MSGDHNMYAGGNVYRGQRSKDSTVKTVSKREWVGLTDDEIREYLLQPVERDLLSFTRFIEAKLKEKNAPADRNV